MPLLGAYILRINLFKLIRRTHRRLCRASPVEEDVAGGLDEKVTAVYKGVGLIMKRFTTGKVPKAFKIIPNLQNWEDVSHS